MGVLAVFQANTPTLGPLALCALMANMLRIVDPQFAINALQVLISATMGITLTTMMKLTTAKNVRAEHMLKKRNLHRASVAQPEGMLVRWVHLLVKIANQVATNRQSDRGNATSVKRGSLSIVLGLFLVSLARQESMPPALV